MLCNLVELLGNSVVESDHSFLGGTTSSHTCLRPFMLLLSWTGLFDVLKCFDQLANTLQYSAIRELILVLLVSRDHLEDVSSN